MRKFLQNRTVVASLCALAGICITANFIRWPGALPLSVRARLGPQPTAVDPASYPIRTPLRVELSLAAWGEQRWEIGQRDPFRPFRAEGGSVGATNANARAVPAPIAPAFVVQAISIDAGRAYAVVNRQVLSVGEQLEGYVLEEIHPTRVRFRGPVGQVDLAIGAAPPPRNQKSASGK
jgi:hypothetical protein